MNRVFSIAGESLEDPPTSGIGKSFENHFHGALHSETITVWLSVVKSEKPRAPTIFALRISRFGSLAAQVPGEELVDSSPSVAQNVLAAEVVELAGIDHELDQLALVFL